jgi:phosphatidylethanolamine-binding protein (PEBP) family uncharacterized protein
MTSTYTCDGVGASPDLSWSNIPTGTKEFALLMSTVPASGPTKYNWVLYGIPATVTSLTKDTFGLGTLGVGDDGAYVGYQSPCSQGAGARTYTFTLYALSATPIVSTSPTTGSALLNAISNITLNSASLNMTYNAPGSSGNGQSVSCSMIRDSTKASKSGTASVACDGTYAYVSSNGLTSDGMMAGITATNLQVPIPQNFYGGNGWKIPLNPVLAANTTSAVDGPVGVAINGVPIFNPCKQGGCQNGDTKALGELDICNGHAGRADDYHYHAAPVCLMALQPSNYWDTHPLGWALDGYAIFGFNDAAGTVAVRDGLCGGNTLSNTNAPAGYSYHVTNTSPYVLSCLRGVPSPDFSGQASKYSPIRVPPVNPLPADTNMSLGVNSQGFFVLSFSTNTTFNTTPNNSSSYSTVNLPGSYQVLYRQINGAALGVVLALAENKGKTACWEFQFLNSSTNSASQPSMNFCK